MEEKRGGGDKVSVRGEREHEKERREWWDKANRRWGGLKVKVIWIY